MWERKGGGGVSSDELPRQDLGILQVKRTRSRARSDTDSARCKWRIVIRGTSLFPRGKRRDLLPDWPCGEVGNFSSVRHRSRRSIIDYSWQRVIFFIILNNSNFPRKVKMYLSRARKKKESFLIFPLRWILMNRYKIELNDSISTGIDRYSSRRSILPVYRGNER